MSSTPSSFSEAKAVLQVLQVGLNQIFSISVFAFLHQIRFDKRIQVSIQDTLRIRCFNVGTNIFYEFVGMQNIISDLRSPLNFRLVASVAAFAASCFRISSS